MCSVTFNDIPDVMERMMATIEMMDAKISALQRQLNSMQQAKPEPANDLICGRFKRGEVINMSDPRLWEGEGAPFKSRYQAKESRKKGCPFVASDGQQSYRITAEKLLAFLTGKSQK